MPSCCEVGSRLGLGWPISSAFIVGIFTSIALGLTSHSVIASAFKDYTQVNASWVKVDSAREMYQNAIGSHPDQSENKAIFCGVVPSMSTTVPRNELPDPVQMTLDSLPVTFWTDLGLTRTTASTGESFSRQDFVQS